MKRKNDGISLRVIHAGMMICAVAICLLLVFSTFQSSNVFSELSSGTGNYIVRQKAAHDLMEASDYLTEMVQRFVQDGETQYMDNYFKEAFTSKRREASITSMADNHAEESLVKQLQEAMDESTSLMLTEYYAMRLVVEAKEIPLYPEQLRGVELTDDDANLTAEGKMELAQYKVTGPEYYERKEIIRNKMRTSLDMMDKQMAATRMETENELNGKLTLTRVLVIIVAVLILVLIFLSILLGTKPLMNAARDVEADKPLEVKGAKEYRAVARAYNKLRDDLNGYGEDEE